MLLSDENDKVDGSPVVDIRTPGKPSRSNHEFIPLKGFDPTSEGFTIQAAKGGKLKILMDLKERGESLEEKGCDDFGPIHRAVRANQCQIIEFLLGSGVNVNTSGGKNLLTPLHFSIRYSSLEATILLLSRGADPSITAQDGTTPLHFAARHGAYDFAKILLGDQRSDVNASDNSGVTPFHLACVSGNLQLCELFLEHGADVLSTTAKGKNALHVAAASGHAMIVELMIVTGKSQSVDLEKFINACDFEYNTPLHLACQKGNEATVEVCLRHGANVEARNDIAFSTPLHVAAMAGQGAIVEILIQYRANVAAANALQRQPIHLASLFGHCDVMRYLIEKGSPIDQRECSSLTPFLCAVKTGRAEAVKLLIDCGVGTGMRTESLQTCFHLAGHGKHMDVLHLLVDLIGTEGLGIGDKNLRTPLHFCAYSNNLKMLELLLSKNTDPSPKDIFGKTPLHMAAANGSMECVRALVGAAPLHISDTDDTNSTPLHEAAVGGHRKVCQYLLRWGADITSMDSNRWTALHHAASKGDVSTVDALLNCSTTSSSQIIDVEDSEGNTPLIAAAKMGNVEVVRLLIKQNADISLRNRQNRTCLDVAVGHGRQPVAMEIVKSEKWYDVLSHQPQDHRFPMRDLIENMPSVAEVVMNRCMKYSDLDPKHRDYWIEFDFRLLHSEKDDVNVTVKTTSKSYFYAPVAMVDSERVNLISHPLTETYLLLSWNCLGRPIFWVNLTLYFIYIYLFTLFLLRIRDKSTFYHPNDNRTEWEEKNTFHEDRYSMATPVAITIFTSFHMLKELYQIYFQKLRYLYHISNYLEWAGYITTLLFMISFLDRSHIYTGNGTMWSLGAMAVLLMYFNLMLFLRRFGMIGIYVSMFLEVLNTMTKVVAVFSIFILAFALTFHIMLKEQTSFRSFGWSAIKTSMMMIGDLDYEGLINNSMSKKNKRTNNIPGVPVPEFTVFILMIFCFFLPVLLMNLLIGLAVGDIDAIQKNATMRRKAMDVDYLAAIEERCPKILQHYFYKPIAVVYPNRKDLVNIIKLSTFGSSERTYSFDKIQQRDRAKDAETKSLADGLEEQKSRTKKMQSMIDEQNHLLKSIANRLQTLSDRTLTPSEPSLDDIDAGSLWRLDRSRSDTAFVAPPAEL